MKHLFTSFAALLICLSLCFSLVSCTSPSSIETETGGGTAAEPARYEYYTRELPEYASFPAAEAFASGDGTETSPYEISNAAELALLASLVNSDDTTKEYAGACYKLTADITVNTGSAEVWHDAAPDYAWTPIGVSAPFVGSFDGSGHTISGLYLNADRKEQSDSHFGLFGYLGGSVKDVKITDSYFCVSGITSELGSIAGNTNKDASIGGCSSDAILEIYDVDCGGIAGNSCGAISDCVFSGSIHALKDKSYSKTGGIAGMSSGDITDCTNTGCITSSPCGIEYAGGIAGRVSDGHIRRCTNSGALNCCEGETDENTNASVFGGTAGGIAGLVYSSSIGGEKYANQEIEITDCSNSGALEAGNLAGGILGSLTDSLSKYPVTVSGCSNTGSIRSLEKQGGIAASISAAGSELTIENCSNTADLTGSAGGIISDFRPESGNIRIRGCSNSGAITGTSYAGGIINSIFLLNAFNARLEIEDCRNAGDISGTQAGGILGNVINEVSVEHTDDSCINIKKCANSGTVSTDALNNSIGGIAGCLGVNGIRTVIEDCSNTGDLIVNVQELSQESYSSDVYFQLCNMAGGIVGRVGKTLYLMAVKDDAGEDEYTDAKDPVVAISGCLSSGNFRFPAADKLKNYCGDALALNRIGGIVGSSSAEKNHSLRIENCFFANSDRGYGNEEHPDQGTKLSSAEIEEKLNG